MGIIDDPISGVLGAFFKRALDSKIWDRIQLLFELAIGATGSYWLFCGPALIAGSSELVARGWGMTAAAAAVIATVQASPHAKGLTISFLQKTDLKIDDSTTTTINRS